MFKKCSEIIELRSDLKKVISEQSVSGVSRRGRAWGRAKKCSEITGLRSDLKKGISEQSVGEGEEADAHAAEAVVASSPAGLALPAPFSYLKRAKKVFRNYGIKV